MSKAGQIVLSILGIGVLALIVWAVSSDDDSRLDASVMGNGALRGWLQSNGVTVVLANQRLGPSADTFSVAILPLHDTDLRAFNQDPGTGDDRMLWTSPRDAAQFQMDRMMELLPTLVVLPKWRYGFAMTGIAHDQTQIPLRDLNHLIGQTVLTHARLLPPENTLTTARIAPFPAGAAPQDIALFRAHLFDRRSLPAHCTELAGTDRGALLVECRRSGNRPGGVVLSDPDLLNNHGLSLADNAEWALGLVSALRAGDARPVYLALDPVPPTGADDGRSAHQRTGDDLSRLFKWPLSALWAMGALVLALVGWRGLARFGPVWSEPGGTQDISRLAAISAKARLLRLAGADQQMAAEHARSHLAQIAAQSLGPAHASEAGVARWLANLARRDAALAAAVQDAATALATPDPLSPAEIAQRLAVFRDLTRKATDAA
jgi:hypothetical protein